MNLRFVWALALLLLLGSKAFAQEVNPHVVPVTVFYDQEWQVTVKEKASFIRVGSLDTVRQKFMGKVTDFYANGTPLLQVNYLEAGKDGAFQTSYSNKKLEQRGIFLKDKPVGIWEYYYASGKPWQTVEYLDNGDFKVLAFYDTTGQQLVKDGTGPWYSKMRAQIRGIDFTVNITGNWKEGKRIGQWKATQKNGKPVFRELFEEGVLKQGVIHGVFNDEVISTYTERENPKISTYDFVYHAEALHPSSSFVTKERALEYILRKEHLLPPSSPGVVYTDRIEQMPEFPGGQAAMFKFLQSNFRMPSDVMRREVNGALVISIVIDATGKVTDMKVVKGLTSSLNQEAMRVIALMPRWKPGRIDGKPVSVQYNIPYMIRNK
ncbi:hypothetical protein GU926_14815 [Nibribacter ruber]|uniref:TonB C-terminal domain-containing protein n=1 Tax=Nibribacter ruber TaxID=2698458 RepID=A0A6P1P2L6_9BACT|nr:energy transducer TonB [Nibribacter ruber]QHL88631.1 hypothetical protein GU926_14815 [Nibribacter ruber]